MSKKIKDEQKKFLGETLNQYDKALDEAINQLDKKNREQNHKISSLVNSFDNEYLEKDVEGNMTTLENSKDGMVIINEIQGSTEVNYCKDGEKELILNGDINTQGESFVTITEGVDGGLVDVSLEGNTEINLSSTKDPVLVTREFDDINCNSGKLQYTIDDVITINDEPGKVDIDRIVGDTMVNHAVNGSEELILNAHINESGDNNITLNGVTSDGGKVDVALEGNTLVNVSKTKDNYITHEREEDTTGNHIALADEGYIRPMLTGNTMVNVCDQKDPVAITKSYTVETGNHVALQGEYDGKCRPVVNGNTLWIDNDTEEVLTEFDNTKNLRLQSSFEDKVVTQEMVDAGEELAENLGKYKVDYVISREDGTVGFTKTFYLNSPLLEGDTIEQQGDNVVHVHRYGKVVLDGGEDWNLSTPNPNIAEAYKYCTCSITDLGAKLNGSIINNYGLVYINPYSNSKVGIFLWNDQIRLRLRDDADSDIEYTKTTLSNNNLTVVYELSTPQYEVISQNDTILCDSYVNGHLDVDSAVPIEKIKFNGCPNMYLKYVYSDTRYILQFEADNEGIIQAVHIGGKYLTDVRVNKGLNKLYLDTILDGNLFTVKGIGFNASNIVVTPAIEQDFGYFSGMQSCFEDNLITEGEHAGKYKVEYKVTGKNKFDKSKGVEIGWVDSIGNVSTTASDCRASYYIPVIPNTTYFTNNPANETTAFYDINKNFISFNMDKSFTTPSNCYYVRCTIKIPNFENDFQLEEGSTATTYEPYKEYKKTLYLNSPLLEGDTIEEKDGNIYHVHRYKELKNKTIIDIATRENTDAINGKLYRISYGIPYSTMYSDKLQFVGNASSKVNNLNQFYGVGGSSGDLWVCLSNTLTTEQAQEFINSCKIIVPLSEPQYEVISQSDTIAIPSYSAGHLDVTSAVPVDKVNFLHFEEELAYLYPSTQYTVQFASDKAITVDITLGGKELLAQSIVTGLNKITITTPETLVDNKLIIDGVGANIKEVVVTEATDRDFGYFEGMKSVGECENLEVVSSNSDSTLSNTQTLTHEPLRAVGDIKDRYVLIDGKWYIERNTAEVVLDGSDDEVWVIDSSYHVFKYNISNAYYEGNFGEGICDKYLQVKGVIGNTLGKFKIQNNMIMFSNNSINSISDWKTYLQSNPTKVIYQLQTPQYEPIDYNPFEVYADITHISVNSSIPCNIIVKNHGYNTVVLKENTQYTLYVNKDTTNTLTYRLGDYVEINSLSKFTFTTPATLTDKTLRITGKGAKVNDLMLIEGTPTNDSIGYFDGLKSSYECEQVTDELDENYGKYKVDIKVVGKNKFDGQWQKAERAYGVYYYGKGTYTISIQEKDLSLLDNSCRLGYSYLDGSNINWMYLNGEVIERNKTLTNGRLVFRMPTKEAFELFKRAFDIQLEEGDTATEYEPYFESKQTVYLNSPLLKGDEIVWKDNKIQHYHKMETIVLDGSDDEGWIKQGDDWDTDNRITFNLLLPKSNLQWHTLENEISTSQNRTSKKVSSDKFAYIYDKPNGSVNEFMSQDGDIVLGGSSSRYLVIGLLKAKLQTQNVVGFKQWLQQNPVKVVYQLATPYYEEISPYPLKLNVIANSSLSTESTIQVTNISFNIYEETLPYLYPNTKYYITFNADVDRNNIIINLGGSHVVFDCKVGFNKVEITTPSNTTNLLTFSGTGVNIDHVKVTQQDIDEYFEGMKSVGECEDLEITSANSDNTLLNTQQLTHEPLRSTGDVKDKYVLIDGKWYIERNCKEVVFDGSDDEGWGNFGIRGSDGNTWLFYCPVNYFGYINDNYYPLQSDKLGTIAPRYDYNKEMIYGNKYREGKYDGKIWLHLFSESFGATKSTTIRAGIVLFKQYLSENPITVVGQLATPYYEEIDYNPFEVYADVTHISTNSLIPTNVVVKNHGYNCILKPSTTYTIALNKPNGTISAKLGGSAKVDSTNSVFTITTPSTLNDNVLRLSGSGNVKDIMILEGDKTINTPSYFEGIESTFEQEYDAEKGKYRVTAKVEGNSKESTIIFYINEPLRGTGTAKDKVYIKDDKVVVQRNCEEVVLDGSENWEIYRNLDNYKTIHFKSRLIEKMLPPNTNKAWGDNICLSNIFLTDKHYTMYVGEDREFLSISNNINEGIAISINKNKLQSQDVQGFKQWLQQNPVTVVYELAEPVYELADCDLSKLVLENYENSSLIFESNIPVSANIRYSGEVPVVTQAKSLSSQVDNTTLDINENIIPYMCDIDYRIVELQLMNGDTQGEGIELLGIGDIEILSNENVLFNNREDKKYNYSYDMLKRDILSQRYSKEEYQYRLDRYLLANKISDEEYKELEGLLNNGE